MNQRHRSQSSLITSAIAGVLGFSGGMILNRPLRSQLKGDIAAAVEKAEAPLQNRIASQNSEIASQKKQSDQLAARLKGLQSKHQKAVAELSVVRQAQLDQRPLYTLETQSKPEKSRYSNTGVIDKEMFGVRLLSRN